MSPNQSRRARAVVLTAVAVAATVSTLFDLDWGGRAYLSLGFFLLVPGCAAMSWRRLDDPLAEVTIGAALSVAISTALALVMLALGRWHPAAAQVGLALASIPLLVIQIRRPDDEPHDHRLTVSGQADHGQAA